MKYWYAAIAAVIGLSVAPARADIFSYFNDPATYGHLDQHDTDCNNVACGPTSAVNSFAYLQNKYPQIYGNKLIPHTNGNTPNQDLVDAANTLGSSTYMNSCDLCNPGQGGTFIEAFINGKAKYFQDQAPGTTALAAMTTLAWRPTTPDAVNQGAKPGFVQDKTAPTLAFLYQQLKEGEDVELFINFSGNQNHYVTLTGISYNSDTNTGFLDFIDPDDGLLKDDITITGLDPDDNDILLSGYLPNANIVNAVAESPVPEPATILLIAPALLGLYRLRHRPA